MAKESKTRESKKSEGRLRWRLLFGLAAAGALGMSTAMAARRVQRYVTTAPQFLLSRERRDAVVVDGITYASRWKVRRVFANDYDRSIFSIPLPERRRRLLAIDWVEDASVSRIWPDRLVVHIRERRPVAFVHLRSGFVLIDRNGILLEQPKHARFAFPVLSGVTDAESETERARRVGAMQRVIEDIGPAAKDISEVNAADLQNLRLITQVDGKALELLVGDSNFGSRYQTFLTHSGEILKRSPKVRLFDLRLDDRILAKE